MDEFYRKNDVLPGIMWDGTDECLEKIKNKFGIEKCSVSGEYLNIYYKRMIYIKQDDEMVVKEVDMPCVVEKGEWLVFDSSTGHFFTSNPVNIGVNYVRV